MKDLDELDREIASEGSRRSQQRRAIRDELNRGGIGSALDEAVDQAVAGAPGASGGSESTADSETVEGSGPDRSKPQFDATFGGRGRPDVTNDGKSNIAPPGQRDAGLGDPTFDSGAFEADAPAPESSGGLGDEPASEVASEFAGLSTEGVRKLRSGKVDEVPIAPTDKSKVQPDQPLPDGNVNIDTDPDMPIRATQSRSTIQGVGAGGVDGDGPTFTPERLLSAIGIPVGDVSDDPVGNIVKGPEASLNATLEAREDIAESVREQQRENRKASDEFIDTVINRTTGLNRDKVSRKVNKKRQAAAETITETTFTAVKSTADAASDLAENAPAPQINTGSTVGKATLAGATGLALAEPTPFGEAALFSTLAGGSILADVLQRGRQNKQEDQIEKTLLDPESIPEKPVPEDPSKGGPQEKPVPEDPSGTGRTELDVPSDGVVSPGGQPIPEDGVVGPASELPVGAGIIPGESAAPNDPGLFRTQQLIGESRGRREELERQRENIFGSDRGADQSELKDILRGPDEEVVLGEEAPTENERNFEPADREPVKTFGDSQTERQKRREEAESLPGDGETGFERPEGVTSDGLTDGPLFDVNPSQQGSGGLSDAQRNRLRNSQPRNTPGESTEFSPEQGREPLFVDPPEDTGTRQDTPQRTAPVQALGPLSDTAMRGVPLEQLPGGNPPQTAEPNKNEFPLLNELLNGGESSDDDEESKADGGDNDEFADVVFSSGIESVEEILKEQSNKPDGENKNDPLL